MIAPVAPTDRDRYPEAITFRLLFTDVDSLHHVNNVALMAYLSEGRSAFNHDLSAEGIFGRLAQGTSFVMARTTTDFLAETRYPGQLEVRTGCLEIGRSSYQLAQAAFQDGRCVVAAVTTVVHREHGKSCPIPDHLRARMAEKLIEGAAE